MGNNNNSNKKNSNTISKRTKQKYVPIDKSEGSIKSSATTTIKDKAKKSAVKTVDVKNKAFYPKNAKPKYYDKTVTDKPIPKIANGKPLFKGILKGNKRGFAFLEREDGGETLFVPHRHLRSAQHGDTVLVKMTKGDEACVERVLERGIVRIVGTYTARPGDAYGFVVPDGKNYYSDIFIPERYNKKAKTNDKVVVMIKEYNQESVVGKIVDIIGNADDDSTKILSILKSHEFSDEFSEQCLKEARELNDCADYGSRTDYRDLLTITIDGDDSKDFDDAVSLDFTKDGYKLYVHIADVSHFVKLNGAIDRDAYERCTSVYFPGKAYPMLPEKLSNDLCSLKEGVDRLTMTCLMFVDIYGNIKDCRIEESVIRSDHRMTYSEVTDILAGDKELCEKYNDIFPMLKNMESLAKLFKARRKRRGNIDLDTKESKIILDENGEVVKVEVYPYTVSNGIIEEFMLAANETVAQFAFEHDLPFIYRIHERPDKEKIAILRAFLDGVGVMLPSGDIDSIDMQQLLEQVAGQSIAGVVNKVMLRSMQKAKYTIKCTGHFGLASEYYCHFTSPIRRYPDLHIHRVLKKYIADKRVPNSAHIREWYGEISSRSSEREVAAERASREAEDFYKTRYMEKFIGEKFDGIISGITSFGIFVELTNTCEGLVKIETLPHDKYEFIPERFLLKGTKHQFRMGQTVRVEVIKADTATNRVTMILEDEQIKSE